MIDLTAARAAATRFFWVWLIAATGASVVGNVTHALLAPHAGSPAIAASMAVALPIVMLFATHGVHALVQARIGGVPYYAALFTTVALALAAFILSFSALRDLAIRWGGWSTHIAWLWPLAVDLGIAGSTLSLLALSSAQRRIEPVRVDAPDAPDAAAALYNAGAAWDEPIAAITERTSSISVAELVAAAAREAEIPAAVAAFLPKAEELLALGVVSRVDRVKVAQVLHSGAKGIAHGTIARDLNVGFNTVKRILGGEP